MNLPRLDSRLSTALKYLRQGKRFADIGTDHAYLPIYSVAGGISSFAVASDINKGPTERARLHVASYSLSDKIEVLQTDGLHGIEKYSPDDIAIFGMGGELIAKIIDEAEWVRSPDIRLILQPMTCSDVLRRYLAENGFDIISETLSSDTGKLYVTICCEYSGKEHELSIEEAILGRYNIDNAIGSPLFSELLARAVGAYKVRLEGKKSAGINTDEEETVLGALLPIQEKTIKEKV